MQHGYADKMTRYRPEVDGLRGIAVLGVLLFHLGFQQVAGGYVGVDVFFVISGYLITRLVRADVVAERFTFTRFYVRRARRLFPALFFTLVLCLAAACLLFSPNHLTNFAKSLIASVVSGSNILFWQESGYFDLDSSLKPLLHTWSLGVEEQFYLLWPWLLVLLLRKFPRSTFAVILTGGICSLCLNFLFSGKSQATIFYLLPFRVFEFAIGALTLWIEERKTGPLALEAMVIAGLVLIATPMLIYSPATPFPTYNALAPCIGAAMLIYAGQARYAGLLLRNRISVGIGLISYSLYLIHWPIIVFYRYFTQQPLILREQVALSVLSLGAAVAMYFFVERPFRYPGAPLNIRSRFVTSAAGLSATAIAISILLVWSGGWPWRIPPYRLSSVEYDKQEDAYCGPGSGELVSCLVDRGSEKNIYVLGDSHARHLVAGLAKSFPGYNIRIMYFPGCLPNNYYGYVYDLGTESLNARCLARNKEAFELFSKVEETNIILAFYVGEADFSEAYVSSLLRVVRELKSHGHHLKVIGDVIRPGIYTADCVVVPAIISDQRQETRCRGSQTMAARVLQQNNKLADILGPDLFINVNSLFCETERACITTIAGKPIFRDTNHLTPFGSEYLISHVAPQLQIR